MDSLRTLETEDISEDYLLIPRLNRGMECFVILKANPTFILMFIANWQV